MAKLPTLERGDAGRMLAELTGMPKEDAMALFKIAELDEFIEDPEVLWRKTGVESRNFHLTADALAAYMAKDPDAPMYPGKPGYEECAGRRCRLYPRHMLLLCLERIEQAEPQAIIGDAYGISQSTVSRYADYVEGVLAKVLPTGDNIHDRVSKADTVEEVQSVNAEAMEDFEKAAGAAPGSAGRPGKTLPHNRIIHDGTHVPRQRPKDKDERRDCYSGKKKRCTDNVVLTVNSRGVILCISDYAPGSTHDLALLRSSKQDLGLVTRCLEGKSQAMKCYEYGDKGFQGLQNDHPGGVVRIPVKRPKGGKLTAAQKRHNSMVGKGRIVVEHSIGRCKFKKALAYPVRRAHEKARRLVVVISGLVNLHLLTGSPDRARNHRKGKKPGPKTARSRS